MPIKIRRFESEVAFTEIEPMSDSNGGLWKAYRPAINIREFLSHLLKKRDHPNMIAIGYSLDLELDDVGIVTFCPGKETPITADVTLYFHGNLPVEILRAVADHFKPI